MTKERTKGLYKVPTMKVNGVWFRGQYAKAFQDFLQGEEITISNFKNGAWESTTNLQRFIDLLNQAQIHYFSYGTSFRNMIVSKDKIVSNKIQMSSMYGEFKNK